MAYAQKPWLNKVWLTWFILQIIVILLVDAVQFYPEWLYVPKTSPLHFLERIHAFYVAEYNDPIVQWDPVSGNPGMAWTRLFAYVEMALQFPVAIYGMYRLGFGGRRAETTSGRDELLFLVYAFETAFSTLVCVHSIGYWDPVVFSASQKNVFVFQLYGPWLAIPSAMFVDMYLRLHARLGALDSVKKTQ